MRMAGWAVTAAVWVGVAAVLSAQQPATVATAAGATGQGAHEQGGRLHGVVKSGNVTLPGVTVTAQNTLTGKRYTTVTDITGAWSMTIPQNGRYVIRTQFAGFAQGAGEALLNAQNHEQTVNLDLLLASRAAAQEAAQSEQGNAGFQQTGGNGLQSLNLMNSGTSDIQAGNASAAS